MKKMNSYSSLYIYSYRSMGAHSLSLPPRYTSYRANINWQFFFSLSLARAHFVGKRRSNVNVSICTNDIQSLSYGYLHTFFVFYQHSMNRHENTTKLDIIDLSIEYAHLFTNCFRDFLTILTFIKSLFLIIS